MVSRCDGVIVTKFPGWNCSTGVREEIEHAHALGISVEMLNPPWDEMERALGDLSLLRRVS